MSGFVVFLIHLRADPALTIWLNFFILVFILIALSICLDFSIFARRYTEALLEQLIEMEIILIASALHNLLNG